MPSSNVPQPRKIAELTPGNLKALMEDLGRGPGIYPSGDLYQWYVGMTEEAGLLPVSKKAFGIALAGLGFKSTVRRFNGKNARCWIITRRATRDHIITDGTVS